MTTMIKFKEDKSQIDHLRGLAKIASESKQYAATTESQLLNLMLSAKDLGISPMKAINGAFYIVNGKVCMSTAMMADRIRKCGHSIKVIEMSNKQCTILAIRKDNGDSFKLEYTWEDATLAGLINSPTWKKFPKNMLYNRCMSQVARILFPDVVGNSYSEEERFDIENVPAEKRPLEDAEAEMVVETPMLEDTLTDAEEAELDALLDDIDLEERVRIVSFVCKRAGVDSIYSIPPTKFKGVITYIEKEIAKIIEKEEEENV